MHDEQTNFQNITEISFLSSSFWYVIVTANCFPLGAHVLIVMGALQMYSDDDDDDDDDNNNIHLYLQMFEEVWRCFDPSAQQLLRRAQHAFSSYIALFISFDNRKKYSLSRLAGILL